MSENKPETAIKIEDYLKAAKTIADCSIENTPYVIALLRQGGFDIPDLPPPKSANKPAETADFKGISAEQFKAILNDAEQPNDRHCVTRIDGTSMMILRELRKQTGLTMMALASKLIIDGAHALGLEDT